MIRPHLFRPDGAMGCDATLGDVLTPPAGCAAWLDIEAPTPEELKLLADHFQFHPLAIEDCTHLQKRAKIERYPTHGFVVLCALDRITRDDLLDTVPVCVFVRPGLVVSVHPKRVTAVERVERLLADEPDRVGTASERVLHALVDAVVDEFLPLVEDQGDGVDALEQDAAVTPTPSVMDALIGARHDLLQVRRIILPHIEVVRRLVDPDAREVSPEYRVYFRDVLDHAMIVHENVTLYLEVANGAIQVHTNAVNEHLNQVMRFLAVVSTLLLPWTIISGIFGMNFDVIPSAHQPSGFWAALGMMSFCTFALLVWFQRKRWVGSPPSDRTRRRRVTSHPQPSRER